MSSQSTHLIQRHQAATLPPSHPKFRNLDSLILQIEAQPRQPRKAVLQLRKRWIERNVAPQFPNLQTEVQR
jgi:hypothetical protein